MHVEMVNFSLKNFMHSYREFRIKIFAFCFSSCSQYVHFLLMLAKGSARTHTLSHKLEKWEIMDWVGKVQNSPATKTICF
jgi:hypothetical protein